MTSSRTHVSLTFVAIMLICLICVMTVSAAKATKPISLKSLQGPPSEFALHQLPQPQEGSISSQSAMYPIVLTQSRRQNGAASAPTAQSAEFVHLSQFAVDAQTGFSLTLVASDRAYLRQLRVTLRTPSGVDVVPSAIAEESEENMFGYEEDGSESQETASGASYPSMSWHFEKNDAHLPSVTGTWGIMIQSDVQGPKGADAPSIFVLIGQTDTPLASHSYITSYDHLTVGDTVGLVTRLMDQRSHVQKLVRLGHARANGTEVSPSADRVIPDAIDAQSLNKLLGIPSNLAISIDADVDLFDPEGHEVILPMHDDGMNGGDLLRSDGVFSAQFQPQEAGIYVAKVEMRGKSTQGQHFYRTSEHVIAIVDRAIQLKKDAVVGVPSFADAEGAEEMIKILLKVDSSDKSLIGKQFRLFAEVHGATQALNWIGGMSVVEQLADGSLVLPLQMSLRWISRANGEAPATLKNVYVQDVTTSVPLCRMAEIKIASSIALPAASSQVLQDMPIRTVDLATARNQMVKMAMSKFRFNGKITETMTYGIRPLRYRAEAVAAKRLRARASNADSHKLVIIHGYCSTNPFSMDSFTDYAIFHDPRKGRSNDEFAKLILELGDDFASISTVAHSQGGLASLHLHSFYWSELDTNAKYLGNSSLATGAPANTHRVLQSVGSPYLGSGLAGVIAAIGEIFGIGCGVVHDLTYNGARLWLATVPTASRNEMYFYTTQYKKGSLFRWTWCHIASQIVLSWPNDGTAEKKYSELAGANWVYHGENECHTDKMRYPAQTKNNARNKEINALAHRGV